MSNILCKISDDDAIKLNETIDELQFCEIKYNKAIQSECPPFVFKEILEYYVFTQKIHKKIWREILIKYVGEDEASKHYNILRFDPVKKAIFKINFEGCNLCR